MSTPAHQPDPPAAQPVRRSAWRHLWRGLLGLALLVAVVAGAIIWYANTASFQDRVRRRVVSTLEQVTGGRVELGALRWRLLHLQIEADNLTIHGLEDSTEIPYAHVDHLLVRAKILSFFRPRISLTLVQVEHPVFHLIVNADGSTNQPRPKKPAPASRSTTPCSTSPSIAPNSITVSPSSINGPLPSMWPPTISDWS